MTKGRIRTIGAIIGDVAGSIYEFHNHRSKKFPLFGSRCFFTDDSVLTLAVGKAVLESRPDRADLRDRTVEYMRLIGRRYPHCGYGGRFIDWLYAPSPVPYNSFGNGSAMRVSAVVSAAASLEEAEQMAVAVTDVTHNHPEGIRGAVATAGAAWLALHGADKKELRDYVTRSYALDFTIDEIRPVYRFNETCMETVPQAMEAFFEAESFEDAIRTAISVGGDSDTLAAITGTVAEAYWGVPRALADRARAYLDPTLGGLYTEFTEKYADKITD